MTKPLPEALKAPVTTLNEAYDWIRGLVEADLLFHFDDGPENIIMHATGAPLFSDADAAIVAERLEQIYDVGAPWWGQELCPIGVALMHDDCQGYRPTADSPLYRLHGEPNEFNGIACFKEGGVYICDDYANREGEFRFAVYRDGQHVTITRTFREALTAAGVSQ